MTDEQALIAEIHNLPKNKQTEAIDAALRLIKNLAKQNSEDLTKRRRPKAGSLAGKIVMLPDFDDPLEEFEEYM